MTSICIYGSVARRDQDYLSDKDALILFDGSDACRNHIKKWKADGWSVASYTPKRLQSMADAGSLFVQHLKQEGLIVDDDNNQLKQIFNSYTPRIDYSDEIEKSAQALRLLEHVPHGIELEYWSADVLHVLIRNIGLLRLANEGIYQFSFKVIANDLIKIGVLNERDLDIFSSLRSAKAAYRGRNTNLKPLGCTIDYALGIIERLCGVSIQRSHSLDLNMPEFEQSYFNMRSIEKTLIAYKGLPVAGVRLSAAEKKLWTCIEDPRSYSWNIKVGHQENWRNLMTILLEANAELKDNLYSDLQKAVKIVNALPVLEIDQ